MSQFQVLNGSLLRGKRDRDQETVQTLSERRHLHIYLEQNAELAVHGECAAQTRLSEAEAETDISNLERRNADIAIHETNRETESQRLELYQANQSADQAQREKISLCRGLEMRNQFHQESRTRTCQEIEELRRNCQARQCRNNELSMHQERDPNTVSRLLTQIQALQDKVIFL